MTTAVQPIMTAARSTNAPGPAAAVGLAAPPARVRAPPIAVPSEAADDPRTALPAGVPADSDDAGGDAGEAAGDQPGWAVGFGLGRGVGAGFGFEVGVGVGVGVPPPDEPTLKWNDVVVAWVDASRTHQVKVWLPGLSAGALALMALAEPTWSQAQLRMWTPSMAAQPSERTEWPSLAEAVNVGVDPDATTAPTPLFWPIVGPAPSSVPLPDDTK
jgi:hypothetical protein